MVVSFNLYEGVFSRLLTNWIFITGFHWLRLGTDDRCVKPSIVHRRARSERIGDSNSKAVKSATLKFGRYLSAENISVLRVEKGKRSVRDRLYRFVE